METKLLPQQPITLKGKLKDFIYISPIIPSSSSFFISFGISLLESLIRLKSCPELEIKTWSCIKSLPLKPLSKKSKLKPFFTSFNTLLTTLEMSTRKDSMSHLTQTIQNQISTIDFGIRLVVCHITKNPSILNGKVRDFDLIIPLLVKHLKISVFLIINTRYKTYKTSEGVPVICLYSDNTSFSVLYHRAAKYVDEKPDPIYFNPDQFPFTNTCLSNPSPPCQTPLTDLVNFLATQARSLTPRLRLQLKSKISELPEKHFKISQLPSIAGLADLKAGSRLRKGLGKLHYQECFDISGGCLCDYQGNVFRKPRIRSVGKPILRTENILCFECRKPYDFLSYSVVSCKGHYFCNKCRNLKVKKGMLNCPSCLREYTSSELSFLNYLI